jgi:hypothetical protein
VWRRIYTSYLFANRALLLFPWSFRHIQFNSARRAIKDWMQRKEASSNHRIVALHMSQSPCPNLICKGLSLSWKEDERVCGSCHLLLGPWMFYSQTLPKQSPYRGAKVVSHKRMETTKGFVCPFLRALETLSRNRMLISHIHNTLAIMDFSQRALIT